MNASPERAIACVMGDMDMLRPLGLAGIPCALVAEADSYLTYSRFVQAVVGWADDFWTNEARLVDTLVRFGRNQAEPPPLYYQQDAQLLLVSRNRERLAEVFRFVLPDPDLVEDLVDKARFWELAQRVGLPVPKTLCINPASSSPPNRPDLRYPLIVKPLTRDPSWDAIGGMAKALEVDTLEELNEIWPRLQSSESDFIFQEMVPGPESLIESYHVYADTNGDIVADFTGKKLRTFPLTCGHSTAVTLTDAADVSELGRDLVRKLRLQGVAKFDFKRGPDGTLHLFEINPRFNLWHHLGAIAGVNLPALVYADLTGQPRPPVTTARAGTSWCQPRRDWRAARAEGMPFLRWLLWVNRCHAKSTNWDDPLPNLAPRMQRHRIFHPFIKHIETKAVPAHTELNSSA